MNWLGRSSLSWVSAFAGLTCFVSCSKKTERSSAELAEIGYHLKADDWFKAIASNDTSSVKHFVDSQFPIDTTDTSGNHALHIAAQRNARDVAEFLIHHHVNINTRGAEDQTPVMAATMADQATMVRWLIKKGANLHLLDQQQQSALFLASANGKLTALAELAPHQHADLDQALLIATLHNQPAAIETLLGYGASCHFQSDQGDSPLHLAAQRGYSDAVTTLLAYGAPRFSRNAMGKTASELALEANFIDLAHAIAPAPNPIDWHLHTPDSLAKALDIQTLPHSPQNSPSPSTNHPHQWCNAVSLAHQEISPSRTHATDDSEAKLPLAMRQFLHLELPFSIVEVDAQSITIETDSHPPLKSIIPQGQAILNSTIIVSKIRPQPRHHSPTPPFLIEVQDQHTGVVHTWNQIGQTYCHDPMAVMEDLYTGLHYIAHLGACFTSKNGDSFRISEIRPNQVIIQNVNTKSSSSFPLVGPKG